MMETMNVTFSCPSCQHSSRVEIDDGAAALNCSHCPAEIPVPQEVRQTDMVKQCLVCASRDLFIRKDFPQRLGVTVVVIGFVLSSIAWAQYMTILTFAILFATALIDVLLYLVMGDELVCYRCGAQYRQVQLEEHAGFNLETHERYRQQAARLAQQRGA
jgi:hypothetical protein